MSTNEFKKENYGGALYLAGQAQNQIRSIESHLSHQVGYSLTPGEVLFAQPLPLKVLKRSNLRQTPSLQAKIKGTLNKGAMIVGYSYKAEWIRVHTEDGGQGWIFQTLVGGR
jgi:SH3-like domain-containing protein